MLLSEQFYQTEKTGYLNEQFRLFHLKDQTRKEFSYHYHDFHKLVIFISGKAAYHIEEKVTVSGFPFHIHRILRNFPVQTGCLSSFPEEQSSDVPDYSFGHLLSGSISAVPAREYRF